MGEVSQYDDVIRRLREYSGKSPVSRKELEESLSQLRRAVEDAEKIESELKGRISELEVEIRVLKRKLRKIVKERRAAKRVLIRKYLQRRYYSNRHYSRVWALENFGEVLERFGEAARRC